MKSLHTSYRCHCSNVYFQLQPRVIYIQSQNMRSRKLPTETQTSSTSIYCQKRKRYISFAKLFFIINSLKGQNLKHPHLSVALHLQQLALISEERQTLQPCTRYRRHIPQLHIWVLCSQPQQWPAARTKGFPSAIPRKPESTQSACMCECMCVPQSSLTCIHTHTPPTLAVRPENGAMEHCCFVIG